LGEEAAHGGAPLTPREKGQAVVMALALIAAVFHLVGWACGWPRLVLPAGGAALVAVVLLLSDWE